MSSEEKLRMGSIYQLLLEEEKLLVEYFDKMIKEGKLVYHKPLFEVRLCLYWNQLETDQGYALIADLWINIWLKVRHLHQYCLNYKEEYLAPILSPKSR